MRVVCLAKGARDDVQPIVVLARALSARKKMDIHVCTHRDHKVSQLELKHPAGEKQYASP